MGRRNRGVVMLAGLLWVAGCGSKMVSGSGTPATTMTVTTAADSAPSSIVPRTSDPTTPDPTTPDPTTSDPTTESPTIIATMQQASSQSVAASATPPPTTVALPSEAVPPVETISAATVPGPFTIAFAGDVHFAGRVGDRLVANPATVFGTAAPGLAAADLTMVNLETAITTAETPAEKSFTFKAPPSALQALQQAGIDVATMANNHGADYGETGLLDSLAAIANTGFPVIGIGANAAAAYAPYRTVLHGHPVAIFAASQVQDWTLANWTAGPDTPGIASAWSDSLIAGVTAAKAAGEIVIVYLHWGIEYETCPDADQRDLADQLAKAGATAVIGAHAHVLQGAGWRDDGVYVAYGLSNFLWWRSLGGPEDNNGVLTLAFDGSRVTGAAFVAAQLDDTGVPVPAVGEAKAAIDAEWEADRICAGLAATPPA